jgi:hypothetical protein
MGPDSELVVNSWKTSWQELIPSWFAGGTAKILVDGYAVAIVWVA